MIKHAIAYFRVERSLVRVVRFLHLITSSSSFPPLVLKHDPTFSPLSLLLSLLSLDEVTSLLPAPYIAHSHPPSLHSSLSHTLSSSHSLSHHLSPPLSLPLTSTSYFSLFISYSHPHFFSLTFRFFHPHVQGANNRSRNDNNNNSTRSTFAGVLEMTVYATLSCNLRVRHLFFTLTSLHNSFSSSILVYFYHFCFISKMLFALFL